MKFKIFACFIASVSISAACFSQDSLQNKKMHATVKHHKAMKGSAGKADHSTSKIYRDTRLGSSSKKYDTYKKNDNGAGAVTTSPK